MAGQRRPVFLSYQLAAQGENSMSHRRKRWITHPGPVIPPPPGRRFVPGHYVCITRDQLFSGKTPNENYDGIPNMNVVSNAGPVCVGVKGVGVPHDWNEMEPLGATQPMGSRFDFGRINADLDQCANVPVAGGGGVMYFIILFVKSFRGKDTNPIPLDMQQPSADNNHSPTGYSTFFTTNVPGSDASGYSAWRWHPTVLARLKVLVTQLGIACGNHPNFGGIITQETSIGFNPNTAVDGYTQDKFSDALVDEQRSIAGAHLSWRGCSYINFMSQGTVNTARIALEKAAAGFMPFGTILGGPDLVTDLEGGNINSRCYPIYKDYQDGTHLSGDTPMPGTGPTSCSIQHAEWGGRSPAQAGAGNVSLMDLYNWATQSHFFTTADDPKARNHLPGSSSPSPLNLSIIWWTYQTSPDQPGGPKFNPDGAAVIAATADFAGPWAP